jgi:hypothetical protein
MMRRLLTLTSTMAERGFAETDRIWRLRLTGREAVN